MARQAFEQRVADGDTDRRHRPQRQRATDENRPDRPAAGRQRNQCQLGLVAEFGDEGQGETGDKFIGLIRTNIRFYGWTLRGCLSFVFGIYYSVSFVITRQIFCEPTERSS